jgi:hypothetical protein
MTGYPHHGPVTRDCPVECLLTVLSRRAFNRLTRLCHHEPFDPPRMVGDVADLCTRHQLSEVHGLGPRHISEIEAALVLIGIDLTSHPQPSASNSHPGGQAEIR